MRVRGRKWLVTAAVLPLVSIAACSGGQANSAAGAGTLAPCRDGLDRDSASEQLPPDFPSLSGSRLYRFGSIGRTRVWFATVVGGSGEVVPVRDRVVAGLRENGYDIVDTDQERDAEAEAQFRGPHEGTVRVRPLCRGRVEVRYKLES